MEDGQRAVALRVPADQAAPFGAGKPVESDLLYRRTHPGAPRRDHLTLFVTQSPHVVETERDVVPVHDDGATEARRIDGPAHQEARAEPARLRSTTSHRPSCAYSPPGAMAYCTASPSMKYSSSM